MRRDAVLEDYALARKNYISEIRKSFEEDRGGNDFTEEAGGGYFSAAKIRLLFAMLLFIGFLYCWYSDTLIFGYSAEAVTEMMEDNGIFTVLSDYLETEE